MYFINSTKKIKLNQELNLTELLLEEEEEEEKEKEKRKKRNHSPRKSRTS